MKSYPSDTRYSSLVLSALDKNTVDKISEYLIVERPKIFCDSLQEAQNNDLIDLSKINVA